MVRNMADFGFNGQNIRHRALPRIELWACALSENTQASKTERSVSSSKLAIYHFAAAWKAVKCETIVNGWNKLLNDIESELQFHGFEVEDFYTMMKNAGENNTTEEALLEWLEEDEGDPGYQIMSESEIAQEVMNQKLTDDENDEEEPTTKNNENESS
uniref:Jerky protein homolog-like n=1 Tax=Geotrypetes seraphini TaxID=260995 RepID=A0A6P8R8L1_GEOSA|nr:jerky protein homolog-like [Geotrypetes seraphini]